MATLLPSCAQVEIKDSEWCGDMGRDGAACFHTLTEESRDLDKPLWDQERFGQVCTTAQTFADWKAAIEKLCSVSGRCTYEQQELVKKFFQRVENFNGDNLK